MDELQKSIYGLHARLNPIEKFVKKNNGNKSSEDFWDIICEQDSRITRHGKVLLERIEKLEKEVATLKGDKQ